MKETREEREAELGWHPESLRDDTPKCKLYASLSQQDSVTAGSPDGPSRNLAVTPSKDASVPVHSSLMHNRQNMEPAQTAIK